MMPYFWPLTIHQRSIISKPLYSIMETILIPAFYYDYHHHLPFSWGQVVRLDASSNYTIFTLVDGHKHISTKTIGLYAHCVPAHFIRVHKGCIINQTFLAEIKDDGKTVVLTDGSDSKVARRRVQALKTLAKACRQ
jgi:DNA-binding LytR/AlgR family response regulator